MDPTDVSGGVPTGLHTSAYGAVAAGSGVGLDDGQQPSFTFYDLPSAAEGLLGGYDDALQGRSTLAMFQHSHAMDPHDRGQPQQHQPSRFPPNAVLMLHPHNLRRHSSESELSVGSGSMESGRKKRGTGTRPGCDWEGSGSGHEAFAIHHGMASPGCLASALGDGLVRNTGPQLSKHRPGAPAPISAPPLFTSSITVRSPQTNPIPASARSGSGPISPEDDESDGARRTAKLNAKRAEQNRTAQKAFRERRGKYIKELEEKALKYDRMEDSLHRTSGCLAEAEDAVHRLSLERGAWVRERELWWRERDEAIRVANTLARELEISQRETEKLKEMVCGFWKDMKNGDEEGLSDALWAVARDARTEGEDRAPSTETGDAIAENTDANAEAPAAAAAAAEVLRDEAGQNQGHSRRETSDETFAHNYFRNAQAQAGSTGGGTAGCTPATHPAPFAAIANEHSQAIAAAVVAHALGNDEGAREAAAEMVHPTLGVCPENSSIAVVIPAFSPAFGGREQMSGSISPSMPASRGLEPSARSEGENGISGVGGGFGWRLRASDAVRLGGGEDLSIRGSASILIGVALALLGSSALPEVFQMTQTPPIRNLQDAANGTRTPHAATRRPPDPFHH
ncbi:hypothetical protein BDK51DRAFT_38435 [Blyttiomyces helicus]|uniref:BZIP domain-containing protein n=1 Tax=Blyttiomyces helicus TaxID=388810 RepID=A0A4P9W1K3_9FUNG|nr:hypothetical protein BDK51DRAFT_38435 [Blyttiomyces helicus]|eukprot:RKO85552.1 hypothetical protein BDK51DRAFT_38435 [Blyttiomyces helicus]